MSGGNKPPVLDAGTSEAIQRATDFATGTLSYHSVAGQPATALLKPLTLMDFIDARVREIETERNRLSMLRDQLMAADCNPEVDVIRRVLG